MKYFYALTCCLFVAAIVLDICGKRYYSFATGIRAKAVQQGQTDQTSIEETVDAALQTGDLFTNAGLIIAGFALISWFFPLVKGKQFWRIIPLVLLITYVLICFMMV